MIIVKPSKWCELGEWTEVGLAFANYIRRLISDPVMDMSIALGYPARGHPFAVQVTHTNQSPSNARRLMLLARGGLEKASRPSTTEGGWGGGTADDVCGVGRRTHIHAHG